MLGGSWTLLSTRSYFILDVLKVIMSNRINYIDRMKGLAILIVVLAHVYIFTFGMGDGESLVFKFCASFEMPLFMFVSGFVAYLSPQIGGAKSLES